MAYTRTKKNAE